MSGSAELPQQDPLALGAHPSSSSSSSTPCNSEPPLYASRPGTLGRFPDTSRSFPIILPKLVPSCPASSREECTICCENLVDTVIYTCGHMCLCYPCGIKLKSMSRACCPICRRSIRDIIKTYSCL
ncbi:hypothetical protein Z043_109854 [Scleropages formosus]|uniref:RING-type domain-containing protein n=1 Tax=Scleropages formosus TaxID=113540 RepID=A0A0P7X9J4_SCLFO|nr:hypothetical protein Z043_109854 [Scleropages formosus]